MYNWLMFRSYFGISCAPTDLQEVGILCNYERLHCTNRKLRIKHDKDYVLYLLIGLIKNDRKIFGDLGRFDFQIRLVKFSTE